MKIFLKKKYFRIFSENNRKKLKNEFKNINITKYENSYRKKRNYNEMINDSKNLLTFLHFASAN